MNPCNLTKIPHSVNANTMMLINILGGNERRARRRPATGECSPSPSRVAFQAMQDTLAWESFVSVWLAWLGLVRGCRAGPNAKASGYVEKVDQALPASLFKLPASLFELPASLFELRRTRMQDASAGHVCLGLVRPLPCVFWRK